MLLRLSPSEIRLPRSLAQILYGVVALHRKFGTLRQLYNRGISAATVAGGEPSDPIVCFSSAVVCTLLKFGICRPRMVALGPRRDAQNLT